jgi:hypothetical protein
MRVSGLLHLANNLITILTILRVLLRICASGYTGYLQSTFENFYHRRCLDSITCWPTNKKKSCPRSIDAGGRHRKPTAPALAKKKI